MQRPSTDVAETIERTKEAIGRCGKYGYPTLGLTPEEATALLDAAEARPKLTPDTIICTGCLRVGDAPPPPALSCCPERKPVTLAALVKARDAALEEAAALVEQRADDSVMSEDELREAAEAIRSLRSKT